MWIWETWQCSDHDAGESDLGCGGSEEKGRLYNIAASLPKIFPISSTDFHHAGKGCVTVYTRWCSVRNTLPNYTNKQTDQQSDGQMNNV